jgi:hypothetical protein
MCGPCCCNIRCVRFAAQADPPRCRFSRAQQVKPYFRALRSTTGGVLNAVLCRGRTDYKGYLFSKVLSSTEKYALIESTILFRNSSYLIVENCHIVGSEHAVAEGDMLQKQVQNT